MLIDLSPEVADDAELRAARHRFHTWLKLELDRVLAPISTPRRHAVKPNISLFDTANPEVDAGCVRGGRAWSAQRRLEARAAAKPVSEAAV